jgi:hypothetical protein
MQWLYKFYHFGKLNLGQSSGTFSWKCTCAQLSSNRPFPGTFLLLTTGIILDYMVEPERKHDKLRSFVGGEQLNGKGI